MTIETKAREWAEKRAKEIIDEPAMMSLNEIMTAAYLAGAAGAMEWDVLTLANFWMHVEKTDYCWIWTGSKNKDGYGAFKISNKSAAAHRLSYEMFNGKINESMCIMHVCDNPSCVNPFHLQEGTHMKNMQDMVLKNRNSKFGKTSKYHGVSYRSDINRWRSFVIWDGNKKHLGSYETEMDAALARDKYIKDKGLSARLSLPPP